MGSWGHRHPCLIWLSGLLAPQQSGRLKSWVPLQGERWGHRTQYHYYPVLCGNQHHCSQEAGVICATFPAAAGFSAAVARGVGDKIICTASALPQFCLLSVYLQVHRCVELQNYDNFIFISSVTQGFDRFNFHVKGAIYFYFN